MILVHMSFLQLNDIESVTSGTRLFGLAASVRVASVWGHFGPGHFGLGTFRSDYEILQKSYMFTF